MSTPHDIFFKHVFSNPERAAAEMQHVLPRDLSATIDWTTLRRHSEAFVDVDLTQSFADLIFTARLDGVSVQLILLLEHKSWPDPLTAFQVLRYKCRALERWIAEHPGANKLPPIYAVVVYHGDPPWNAAQDVADLFDMPASQSEQFGRWLVRMRYGLDDLNMASDSELRARATDAVAKLALFCLQRSRRSDDLLADLADVAELFGEVRAAPGGRDALRAVFSYIMSVRQTPPDEIKRFLRVNVNTETEREFVTIFDEIKRKEREEGRAEGREEGREEGLEEGREEGLEEGREEGFAIGLRTGRSKAQRELLQRQIERKFGSSFDAEWRSRLAGGTDEQIASWLDRVLEAERVEQIFAS